ncbi:AAA family ATPase, partial [Inhella proteolytica]
MSFARTKIQAPRLRAALVDRGPLQARLLQALQQQRLVLLCAPAGFGKTALLAQAAAARGPGQALAWISADSGDDLHHLLECLLAALEPFDPPWRSAPESILRGIVQPDPALRRAKLAELLNALELCETAQGLIVFDDLHRVSDPAFFAFLDELLERLSPKWTLALATRTEPPLALARRRAAGELAEFRQPQLQFSEPEARALLAGTGLDEAAVARLFERTQGWPAGLRMALGVLQGEQGGAERLQRASERSWFDFLLTEVLEQLPAPLADFLQAVSVLPELQPARCAALTGDALAAERLAEIERLGLFVDALDDPAGGGLSLRLHDLFREALQQRLRQAQPERWRLLCQRMLQTEPDPLRRLQQHLELGELGAAATLAAEQLPALIVSAGATPALHLMQQFPPAEREHLPELAFVRGLAAWTPAWDFERMHREMERAALGYARRGAEAERLLACAYDAIALMALGRYGAGEALLKQLQQAELAPAAQLMRLTAEVWAAIDTCRYEAVAPHAQRMLALLVQLDRPELWYQTTPPLRMPGLPGMTDTLERHADQLLRVAGEQPIPLRTIALQIQAWCALWRGRTLEAEQRALQAREDAHWGSQLGAVRSYQLCLDALLALVRGDAAAALQAATERQREFNHLGNPWYAYLLPLFRARVAASAEQGPALREALAELAACRPLQLPGGTATLAARELPLQAQLAWLEGRAQAAVQAWQDALALGPAIDLYGLAGETRLRLAWALCSLGQQEPAARTLQPLFEAARRDGPGGALLAGTALAGLAGLDWGPALADADAAALRAWQQAVLT